jgi:aldehyde dehydrogenase (NAD+)
MGYINSGKTDGAKLCIGGERHGKEGYFIKPTIFLDAKPSMKIMQEEIFGPVCCIVKFKTEEGERGMRLRDSETSFSEFSQR